MKNLEVIKKIVKTPCYLCCEGLYGKTVERSKCPACNGTGKYSESHYYHIYTDKNGQKTCFDGESVK